MAKFQTKAQKSSKVSPFYAGDLVTCTGEREISAVFESLPESWNNYMVLSGLITDLPTKQT